MRIRGGGRRADGRPKYHAPGPFFFALLAPVALLWTSIQFVLLRHHDPTVAVTWRMENDPANMPVNVNGNGTSTKGGASHRRHAPRQFVYYSADSGRRPSSLDHTQRQMIEAKARVRSLEMTARFGSDSESGPTDTATEEVDRDVAGDHGRGDPFNSTDCAVRHEWQKRRSAALPTCNHLHEADLAHLGWSSADADDEYRILADGGYQRDVWLSPPWPPVAAVAPTGGARTVLKTGKVWRDLSSDREALAGLGLEALVHDRLAASPSVLGMHAYCAGSGVFEYAPGGALRDAFTDVGLSGPDRLRVAAQVAGALADLHGVDADSDTVDGPSSVSTFHGDVHAHQFARGADGVYKLFDFERSQFLGWDGRGGRPCKIHPPGLRNPNALCHNVNWASPEKCRGEPLDEKMDVYALGHVLRCLVARQPYVKGRKGQIDRMLRIGEYQPLPRGVRERAERSEADAALVAAMEMCYASDAADRPGAGEVHAYLVAELARIERG